MRNDDDEGFDSTLMLPGELDAKQKRKPAGGMAKRKRTRKKRVVVPVRTT